MRSSAVAIFLAFGLIGVAGLLFRHLRVSQSGNARPVPRQVSLARVHQIGTIWEGIPRTVSVILANTSSHELAVTRMHASCQCTRIAPEGPFTFLPGEKKRLTLTLKVPSSSPAGDGSIAVRVIPQYSSGETGTGWLLKGTLRRAFLHAPQLPLDIGLGDFPLSAQWDFRLSPDLELVSIASGSTGLQTSYQKLPSASPGSNHYRVAARLRCCAVGMMEEYPIELSVRDRQSGDVLPRIVLRATWRPLVVVPETVAIGAEPVGAQREQTMVLQPRHGAIVRVVAETADDTTAVLEEAVKSDGMGAVVRIRQRVLEAGSNRTSVRLAVEMRDGNGKRYVVRKEIPISYYGSPVLSASRSTNEGSTSDGPSNADIES